MSCLGRVAGTALVAGVVAMVVSGGSDATIVALPGAEKKPPKAAPAAAPAASGGSCVELPKPAAVLRHAKTTPAAPIPAEYRTRYEAAGKKYGLPWQLLAAVGMIETRHGAMTGTSSAGARGPMQFMPTTWAAYGVDGDGDGRTDILDPDDAVPAAANYLVASGAKTDVRRALFAYNRADWYVNDVLTYAHTYAPSKCTQPGPVAPLTDARACKPTGSAAERGVQPATLAVMRCAKARFPAIGSLGGLGHRPNKSDHPTGYATDLMIAKWDTPAGNQYGWQVANWVAGNAGPLRVSYIIWDDKIWRARSKTWESYTHPNGPTRNATLRHLDHVHVSVTR